jgi:hypothetical protein
MLNSKVMATISNPGNEQTISESVTNHPHRDKSTHGISGFFPAIVNMIAEDGGSFFNYLKDLGLSRDNNLVVLSSRHHYFYDEDEMKNVRTLINLRKLNLIKYLDEFLFTLVQVLPPDTKFLGCFSDSNTSGNNDTSLFHPIRLLKQKVNRLDFLGEKTMNKNKVSGILESYGFKIINMTEMNGLTYFCSQNVRKPTRLRA